MISYHIIASVSLAQREDLERQANRLRTVHEGRAVRKRTLRDARLRRSNLSPHSAAQRHRGHSLPLATGQRTTTYLPTWRRSPDAGRPGTGRPGTGRPGPGPMTAPSWSVSRLRKLRAT